MESLFHFISDMDISYAKDQVEFIYFEISINSSPARRDCPKVVLVCN